MMKAQSCLSGTKWLLVTIMCILIILSPTVLISKPVHAQDTYEELIPALQGWRQHWAEYLVSYQSMDVDERATADAFVARLMQPYLRDSYGVLSASERANLDEELRKMSGYTMTQLIQSSSTIPGVVKALDIIISALQNLSGGANILPTTKLPTTTPQTSKPSTTTQPPMTTPSNREITLERPSQEGEVFFKEPGGDWKPVSSVGQIITVSDGFAVRTGKGSVVIRDFPYPGDKMFVRQNTEIQLEEQGSVLNLLKGAIRVLDASLKAFGKKFECRCVPFVVAVRGTDFIIDYTPEQSRILVFEGTVEFSDLERHPPVPVKAGEYSVIAADGLHTEPQIIDNATVFQEYQSLFNSEEEMKAVIDNMEKLVKSRETRGFLIYLLIIPVIIIAVVIWLVIRRRGRLAK